ncbi:MAG: hypothetical protein AAGU05_15040, partial [Anaerolineaceae bacterium]
MEENTSTHHGTENPNLKQAREHFREARRSMKMAWENMMPPEVRDETRRTRTEILRGFRKILD